MSCKVLRNIYLLILIIIETIDANDNWDIPNVVFVLVRLSGIKFLSSFVSFFQAFLGSIMKWHELSFVNGGYAIVLFFVSFIFPETPYFVLMNDSPENTLKVLKKFRASTYNVEAELEQMLEYKVDNEIHKWILLNSI